MTEDEDQESRRAETEPQGAQPERALVLVPVKRGSRDGDGRDAEALVEEAVGLARAIELDIVDGLAVPLSTYRPATLTPAPPNPTRHTTLPSVRPSVR